MATFEHKQKLRAALNRLYAECPGGGPVHIVTDDYNTADGHLAWCQERLSEYAETPEQVALCEDVLRLLWPMTKHGRAKLLKAWRQP